MVRDDNEESGWRKVVDPVDPNLIQSSSLAATPGASGQDLTAAVVVDAEEVEMYEEESGENVL